MLPDQKVYVIEYRNPEERYKNTYVIIAFIERKKIPPEEQEILKIQERFKSINVEFKPVFCCLVDKLPKTENGKDKKDLNSIIEHNESHKIFSLINAEMNETPNDHFLKLMNKLWADTLYGGCKPEDITAAMSYITGKKEELLQEDVLVQFCEDDRFIDVGGDSLLFTSLINKILEELTFSENPFGDLLRKSFKLDIVRSNEASLREMTQYFILYKNVEITLESLEESNIYYFSLSSEKQKVNFDHKLNTIHFKIEEHNRIFNQNKTNDTKIIADFFANLITSRGDRIPIILWDKFTEKTLNSCQNRFLELMRRKPDYKIPLIEEYSKKDLNDDSQENKAKEIEEKVFHSINLLKSQPKGANDARAERYFQTSLALFADKNSAIPDLLEYFFLQF